jgi:nucleoside-diphosphate-sugar epimerase
MIIGNGLIANALRGFRDNQEILLFASGVSDSSESREEAFKREHNLIEDALKKYASLRFIYISTCSIYDDSLKHSPYLQHKLAIEKKIQENHDNYLILRLPNMVGRGGNPKTMVNYFVHAIRNNQKIQIQKSAFRNLLDCDVLEPVLKAILNNTFHNEIINIANPVSYRVSDIVHTIEKHLNKKADIEWIEGGGEYDINLEKTGDILFSLRNDYGLNYLTEMLNKYIPN